MAKALLFNPENDLALASGMRHFNAPRAALELHRAGALLPMWWAQEQDIILTEESMAQRMEELKNRFGLHGTGPDKGDLTLVTEAEPWGWSLDARRQFAEAGVAAEALPSDMALAEIRRLSHRRLTRTILEKLDYDEDFLPYEAMTTEDALRRLDEWGDTYIKLPWSSSGRGIFHVSEFTPANIREMIPGIIRRQGSVMIERARRKRADFAALFHCDGSRVEFRGLSLFTTDRNHAYSGNLIMSDDMIERRIGAEVVPYAMRIEPLLSSEIAPYYKGWLGVDMMVCDDSGPSIAPCVEINLRMTMGVVAKIIGEKLLGEGEYGILSVTPGRPAPGALDISSGSGDFAITLDIRKS